MASSRFWLLQVLTFVVAISGFQQIAFAQAMVVNITNVSTYATGRCLVKISPIDGIADQAGIANGTGDGQCSRGFISFDCAGELGTSRAVSNSMVTTAQMAYVTGNRVYVVPDATRKVQGYCTVSRIDNLPN